MNPNRTLTLFWLVSKYSNRTEPCKTENQNRTWVVKVLFSSLPALYPPCSKHDRLSSAKALPHDCWIENLEVGTCSQVWWFGRQSGGLNALNVKGDKIKGCRPTWRKYKELHRQYAVGFIVGVKGIQKVLIWPDCVDTFGTTRTSGRCKLRFQSNIQCNRLRHIDVREVVDENVS